MLKLQEEKRAQKKQNTFVDTVEEKASETKEAEFHDERFVEVNAHDKASEKKRYTTVEINLCF